MGIKQTLIKEIGKGYLVTSMRKKVYIAEPPNFNYTFEDYFNVIKSMFKLQLSKKLYR